MDLHTDEFGRYDGAALAVIPAERLTDDLQRGQALLLLAKACSSRMTNAELEQRRIEVLAAALLAAREASDAMHSWLAQSLSEYRGSRTAWDLQATSERLERALAHFDETVRETAALLRARIPALTEQE